MEAGESVSGLPSGPFSETTAVPLSERRLRDLVECAVDQGWRIFGLLDAPTFYGVNPDLALSFSKKLRVTVAISAPNRPTSRRTLTREQIFFGDNLGFLKALFPGPEPDQLGLEEHKRMAVTLVLLPRSEQLTWLHRQVFVSEDDGSMFGFEEETP